MTSHGRTILDFRNEEVLVGDAKSGIARAPENGLAASILNATNLARRSLNVQQTWLFASQIGIKYGILANFVSE